MTSRVLENPLVTPSMQLARRVRAQAVLSAGFARLGLAGQRDVAVGHFIGKKVAHRGGKRSLRSLHFNDISPNLHLDTGGNGDGQFSDSRHATPAYQISHKSSPPTFIW